VRSFPDIRPETKRKSKLRTSKTLDPTHLRHLKKKNNLTKNEGKNHMPG
jgi:hypothetical protein